MSVGLTIEAAGVKELSVQLGISAENIQDFRAPLEESAAEIIKSFDLNFEDRGRLFSDGWVPRKVEKTWPILEKTGALRKGFTSSVGLNTAVIGNSDFKFPYHQLGTRRGIPARIMLKLDATRKEFVVKSFQLHLVNALRNI